METTGETSFALSIGTRMDATANDLEKPAGGVTLSRKKRDTSLDRVDGTNDSVTDKESAPQAYLLANDGVKPSTPPPSKIQIPNGGTTVVEFRDTFMADGDQSSSLIIDNDTEFVNMMKSPLFDGETGDLIEFTYAFVTPKSEGGDRQLAEICTAVRNAGAHSHTYDAHSGANYRMTRVGATASRLDRFADAIGYINEFDPVAVKVACEEAGIELDNGESAAKVGIHLNTKGWYEPYSYLSGEYSFAQRHLFAPFTNGDYVYLMNLLLRAPTDDKVKRMHAKEAKRIAAEKDKVHMQTAQAHALNSKITGLASGNGGAVPPGSAEAAKIGTTAEEKTETGGVGEKKKARRMTRKRSSKGKNSVTGGGGSASTLDSGANSEDLDEGDRSARRGSSKKDLAAGDEIDGQVPPPSDELADLGSSSSSSFTLDARSATAGTEAATAQAAPAAEEPPDEGRGCGFDLEALATSTQDELLAFFVMHHLGERAKLVAKWMRWSWPWNIPVDDVNEYFGKEMAFYFTFLRRITTGMFYIVPLAIVFQVAQAVGAGTKAWAGQPVESLWALVATICYGLLLDAWRMEQASYSHVWGVYGFSATVSERPEHVNASVVKRHEGTGILVYEFPANLRRKTRLFSTMVTLFCIAVLFVTVVAIFAWKASLVASNASSVMLMLPLIANTAQVSIFGALYQMVAEYLTTYENHRTAAKHNQELFRKLTAFYVINYYASLFYIAFFKGWLEPAGCLDILTGSTSCGRELATQTIVLFLSNDFAWRLYKSIIEPPMLRYVRASINDLDEDLMCPPELQFATMGAYDPTSSLVGDYIELFVQWGYLVLFGATVPAVVALCFLTNYVECLSDGYKLCFDFRRVLPRRMEGIGEVTSIFYAVLYLAVPVNAGLVVYTFDAFNLRDNGAAGGSAVSDSTGQNWRFVTLCFALGAAMRVTTVAFPDVPRKTEVQLGRQALVHAAVVKSKNSDAVNDSNDLEDMGLRNATVGQTAQALALANMKVVETKMSVMETSVRCFEVDPVSGHPKMVPTTSPI